MNKNKVLSFGTRSDADESYDRNRTFIAGVIFGILNLATGLLFIILGEQIPASSGIFIFWVPYVFTVLFAFSSWLAWKGHVAIGFYLILGGFLIQLLIYSITTTGFGTVFGIISFTVSASLIFVIVNHKRINLILLLAGLYSPLLFLLDHYGPQNRVVLPDILNSLSVYLVGLVILLFIYNFIRNFASISVVVRIVIPIVIFAYLTTAGITLLTKSQLDSVVEIVNSEFETIPGGIEWIKNWESSVSIFSAAILIPFTLIISWIISQIFQPITHLAEQSRRVQAGNLNVRARIHNKDETGLIADTFNSTVSRLRQITETLDLRVEDRTRDLASQNAASLQKVKDIKEFIEILRILAKVEELELYLQTAVNSVAEKMGFSKVSIFLVDPKRETISLRAASNEEGKRLIQKEYKVRVGGKDIVNDVVRSGELHLLSDLEKEGNLDGTTRYPGSKSEICLPLKHDGNVIGVLDVQSDEINGFSGEHTIDFTILSELITRFIVTAQHRSEILNELTELQLQQPGNKHKDWERDNSVRFDKEIRYVNGFISTWDKDNDLRKLIDWGSLAAQGTIVIEPLEISLPKDTFASNKDNYKEQGSALSIPILLDGELIGQLELQEADPTQTKREGDLSLAQAVADHLRLALKNAKLFEETRRRADRETTVNKIITDLRANTDPDIIMQKAIEGLQEMLQVKKARIIFTQQVENPDRLQSDGLED